MSPISKKNDDIYIDCKPVDMINNDIDDDDNNYRKGGGDSIFNSLTSITPNVLTENIGFQTVLGIALIVVIYGVGSYFFKDLPRSIVQDRINSK